MYSATELRCLDSRCGCAKSGAPSASAFADHLASSRGRCPRGLWPTLGSPQPELPTTAAVIDQVTFAVTHFERPAHLARLVTSIRQRYATARIVVADNSFARPVAPEGVVLLELPSDCGLSAARNGLIDRLATPYMMVLEEDFRFSAETRVEGLLDVLRHHPEVGCVGGSLRSGGVSEEYAVDFELFRGVLHGQRSTGRVRVTDAGTPYQLCDMVYNFGLWRRELLASHRWDDRLKLGEHAAYFWDVKQAGKWLVAQCPSVMAEHDYSGRTDHYRAHRHRATNYMHAWYRQAGIKEYRQDESLRSSAMKPSRPDVVVLGVGHSGTSILAKMLHGAGWQAGDADVEYSESVSVRSLNGACLRHGWLDRDAATRSLAKLPSPWCVKDPRFVTTLDKWLPIFADMSHPPLLVWITRDSDAVAASYVSRGEAPVDSVHGLVAERLASAGRQYALWPWRKVAVEYERLAEAAGLFSG